MSGRPYCRCSLMRKRRIALVALTAATLTVGTWALFAPHSFYTSFPFGRGWVALHGAYNEHLIRDFGAMNLALATLTAVAGWQMRAETIRLAAVARAVFALPHPASHGMEPGQYPAAVAIAVLWTARGAPWFAGAFAWALLAIAYANTAERELNEGEQVRIGDLVFDILHTPGHSEGSVCLYEERRGLLLSGDVLFAGSYGRTDLPGGSDEQQVASLTRLGRDLPAATRVLPGHGPETTIERELPWLRRVADGGRLVVPG